MNDDRTPTRDAGAPLRLRAEDQDDLAIIAACLQYIPSLVLHDDDPYGPGNVISTFKQDMLFSLGISFVFNSILRVRSLIGGRVFTNFLLGRYHHPVRENRVFMFLDLADSSYLSEKLGDIQVQSLIGRIFSILHSLLPKAGERPIDISAMKS